MRINTKKMNDWALAGRRILIAALILGAGGSAFVFGTAPQKCQWRITVVCYDNNEPIADTIIRFSFKTGTFITSRNSVTNSLGSALIVSDPKWIPYKLYTNPSNKYSPDSHTEDMTWWDGEDNPGSVIHCIAMYGLSDNPSFNFRSYRENATA